MLKMFKLKIGTFAHKYHISEVFCPSFWVSNG